MDLKEFYEAVGGSYSEVVSRLQRDSLIMSFVKRFTADGTYEELKQAKNENDIKKAFLAAHTLKGVASTLGMKNLMESASDLTEKLRPLKEFPGEEYFTAVDNAYRQVIDLIAEL